MDIKLQVFSKMNKSFTDTQMYNMGEFHGR